MFVNCPGWNNRLGSSHSRNNPYLTSLTSGVPPAHQRILVSPHSSYTLPRAHSHTHTHRGIVLVSERGRENREGREERTTDHHNGGWLEQCGHCAELVISFTVYLFSFKKRLIENNKQILLSKPTNLSIALKSSTW